MDQSTQTEVTLDDRIEVFFGETKYVFWCLFKGLIQDQFGSQLHEIEGMEQLMTKTFNDIEKVGDEFKEALNAKII